MAGYPHPHNIPTWEAPHPFEDQTRAAAGNTRKALLNETQASRVRGMLIKLCGHRQGGVMRKRDFFKDSEISDALNAYNLRSPSRTNAIWAYTKMRGLRTSIDVPRNPPASYHWSGARDHCLKLTTNFLRDFNGAWTPSNVPRVGVNAIRYRFIFWIHKHEYTTPPFRAGRPGILDEIYSIIVLDRETFWANVRVTALGTQAWAGLPAGGPTRVTYASLAGLPARPRVPPKFSQLSVVAIALSIMNQTDDLNACTNSNLTVRDHYDILSGRNALLFPNLIMCLWQTIRDVNNRQSSPANWRRSNAAARANIQDNLEIQDNDHLRDRVRRRLNLRYPAGSRRRWIVDAIAP
ncbi:hypothetical protein BJ170DRAFT_716516 [Xylariales sp. AK1849]|nr:hypothetical protein BJ170DRAFT_716516 [Xylariales sp. AK1849]